MVTADRGAAKRKTQSEGRSEQFVRFTRKRSIHCDSLSGILTALRTIMKTAVMIGDRSTICDQFNTGLDDYRHFDIVIDCREPSSDAGVTVTGRGCNKIVHL